MTDAPTKPTKYDQALADEIIDRISEGQTVRGICRLPHMPRWNIFYQWEADNQDFKLRIAHARDIGADAIAQEALDIADTPMEGIIEKTTAQGFEMTKQDMLGHRKLQIETRLKLLAKWNPRKYGEKIETTHEIGDSIGDIMKGIRGQRDRAAE